MDKRLKRHVLTLYADGLNAHDITIQHNLNPRITYTVTAMEVADVLRELGVKDPHRRIEQKPEIQPDMPKQFIPITSVKKREKLSYKPQPTKEQKEWHAIVCGVSKNGKQLLKSGNRHHLERKIVEYLERGYELVGNISTDFYHDGETYMALVQKKEEHH